MAAPIAAFIQLPSDTGNTGKKVRTQTRVVGADTVHEHFFIATKSRSITGAYQFHSGNLTIQASAQNGTATGFFWWFNPIGATIKMLVHHMRTIVNITTNLSMPTAPRILFKLFTYTGTPSGASITPSKRDSTDAAAQGNVRTAMTGMTVSLGADIHAALPPVTAGTAGWTFTPPYEMSYDHDDDDYKPVLRAGEGIVCYQPDAGTAADTRRIIVNSCWSEFE